ncbi:MAG TPA: ATP-grasp domain-containing protein [Capsulimonadaceae bacterium]|nr:ATP-grasp domain-containing protein [Capsulimonadaceae bacterium]
MIVFCCDPLRRKWVDSEFLCEWNAARAAGFEVDLVSIEDLIGSNSGERAVTGVSRSSEPRSAIYRGWMLTPSAYRRLYDALLGKNCRLVTSPAQYQNSHYLPKWYGVFQGITPKSAWLPACSGLPDNALVEQLAIFGDSAVVVKDYVKSRKHEWAEACYVPRASDTRYALQIIRRSVELQGDDLNEGIVLREFVRLRPLGAFLESGMPLSQEWRTFVFNGAPTCALPYWSGVKYPEEPPDLSGILSVATHHNSPFFAMDIAKIEGGQWIVIEIGDGQVSSLLDSSIAPQFYLALREQWPA